MVRSAHWSPATLVFHTNFYIYLHYVLVSTTSTSEKTKLHVLHFFTCRQPLAQGQKGNKEKQEQGACFFSRFLSSCATTRSHVLVGVWLLVSKEMECTILEERSSSTSCSLRYALLLPSGARNLFFYIHVYLFFITISIIVG